MKYPFTKSKADTTYHQVWDIFLHSAQLIKEIKNQISI